MKFEVQGLVERIPGLRGEISSALASGGIVKSATNADELKAEWHSAMRQAFGNSGPDYNIEFHCTVTQVPDETPEGPVPAKIKIHTDDLIPRYDRVRRSIGQRFADAAKEFFS